MSRRRRRDSLGDLLAWAAFVVVLVAFIALAIWLRQVIPCGWFPLAEAPVRCLPGAP